MEEKDRKISDEKIYNNLIKLPQLIEAETVLCYASTPIEVDTRGIISRLLADGKTVAVPRCEGKEMRFFTIDSLDELKTGAFGVPEPIGGRETTDFSGALCITPALSISKDGYRLGYGGGFYDRFLAKHRPFAVGLCYSSFIGEVPAGEYDQRVDIIITETDTIVITEAR